VLLISVAAQLPLGPNGELEMTNDQPSSYGGAQHVGTTAAQNGHAPPNTHGWDDSARQAAEAAYRYAQEQMNKNK
jgi:hypothetical protein